MNYRNEILTEYAKLHFTPRDNQLEIIDSILTKFLREGCSNVILCAGTGAGKSVMGMVVARVIANIEKSKEEWKETKELYSRDSNIIMNTNVLVDQYIRSFSHLKEDEFFFRKGASNYPCPYMKKILPPSWTEPVTAESCVKETKCNCKDICEYYKLWLIQKKAKCLVSNYSYYMMLYVLGNSNSRSIINVFDEAHTMNDVFANFCNFTVTNKYFDKIIELYQKVYADYKKYFTNDSNREISLLNDFRAISASLKVITIQDEFDLSKFPVMDRPKIMKERQKQNVEHFRNILKVISVPMKRFKKILSTINEKEFCSSIFPWEDTKESKEKYQKENKLSDKEMKDKEEEYSERYQRIITGIKKCNSLISQIELIEDDDELLFENVQDGDKFGISASPVFIKKYWSTLNKSKYNLFMSATITKEYMQSTVELEGKTEYIYIPSTFPKENKMIIDYKSFPLNYANMKNQQVVDNLLKNCSDIVSVNSDVNGIILTTTFDLTRKIADYLRKTVDIKVFEHEQGTKVSNIIEQFVNYKSPCVLVSPSLWEGISFDDDISRYQIVCKTPYGSLGSKRNKYIQYKLPEIYSQQTLLTLIQGFGRSVRNANDFCFTFCLDRTTFQILNKPSNVWKNDFTYGTIN